MGIEEKEDATFAAVIVAWVGTRTAPLLGAELWDFVAVGAPTEHLREALTDFCLADEGRQAMKRLFTQKGISPAVLRGEGDEHTILRWAAWEFVRGLAKLAGLECMIAFERRAGKHVSDEEKEFFALNPERRAGRPRTRPTWQRNAKP